MVDAFVAADTKRSWKAMAMAAGCDGGGVLKQSLGGGTKDYPLQISITQTGSASGIILPHGNPPKKGVTYLIMTAK